jgi:hypothetical protein
MKKICVDYRVSYLFMSAVVVRVVKLGSLGKLAL